MIGLKDLHSIPLVLKLLLMEHCSALRKGERNDMEEGVKSVERAFKILEQVSIAKNGMGITELSNELSMYKSTIHRVLTTLSQLGYVDQNPDNGKYKLSYKILDLSSRLLNNLDVRRVAIPYLHELAELTNEVVHLVVRDQGQVVYIEKVEGSETIRMHSRIGNRVPVHCASVGKAILAYLPPEQVQDIITSYGLAPHTPYTLITEEALFEDLHRIRERGYALDMEENELGIICVAAPIFDFSGQVIASLSASGPSMRMQSERLVTLSAQVKNIGTQVSMQMGYQATVI